MSDSELFNQVQAFARLTCALPDADLELPWVWQDYDEGVRFAFFRIYQSLRELAVEQSAKRAASGERPSSAQRIMAQYHAAYLDLQAVLLGWSEAELLQPPAEGEWPARQALAHIINAERNFYFAIYFALQDARQANEVSTEVTEEMWDEFWAGDPFPNLKEDGSAAALLEYYAGLHARILSDFSGITEAELEAPAWFWEAQPYPIRFRLHRFEAHLRQHTIQIEKTISSLDLVVNETRRLSRLMFAGLAEVEGTQLGWGSADPFGNRETAEAIHLWGEQVASIIAHPSDA